MIAHILFYELYNYYIHIKNISTQRKYNIHFFAKVYLQKGNLTDYQNRYLI